MKNKPIKVPVGWRVLTPTEKIKAGDYCTSKNNLRADDPFWQSEYCQAKLKAGIMTTGFCPVDSYAQGKTIKYCRELLYITPKKDEFNMEQFQQGVKEFNCPNINKK